MTTFPKVPWNAAWSAEADYEFLENIVLPSGQSAGEWMRPQIAEAYRVGTMPALLPMLPSPSKGER